MSWTRITHPDEAIAQLPAWFGSRMIGLGGSFGLLLATGDVLRVASIVAAHVSSGGMVLLDVLLDRSGPPGDVDAAWGAKHYLGAPVPAAALATVNLAHVVAMVEFVAAEMAESPTARAIPSHDEVMRELDQAGLIPTVGAREAG